MSSFALAGCEGETNRLGLNPQGRKFPRTLRRRSPQKDCNESLNRATFCTLLHLYIITYIKRFYLCIFRHIYIIYIHFPMMMPQGWHGVFEWCFPFQILTFDSLGSCTSTESNTSPWAKTYASAISTALLHISSLNHNQLDSSRVAPASPETPSLNLRTVGLAVLLPPKSPGTAKDRTASHQHLRVAIRFR